IWQTSPDGSLYIPRLLPNWRGQATMATATSSIVIRHIRSLMTTERTGQLPDHTLLDRFAQGREEAAFATLVRRHGPLVLGVCRRVLHNPHDAEDAFQATFLVLARKAGSVGRQGSLAGWLYQVAYHLAIKARAQATNRRHREGQTPVCHGCDSRGT